ncbi:hypothetical protein CEXT_315881 [Caerostris extrusa]|uniref:Uncharacterized protein n=1 Tax=Caerostris extrusa TaxID=172846 RepID=A0AAV4MD62_CAEEX|nr:hypothetical protein CEXT_57251 [Caerostris extrusa]GIY42788.1 hypothetical protein CEXT_315881 [Caerostris extrusa]
MGNFSLFSQTNEITNRKRRFFFCTVGETRGIRTRRPEVKQTFRCRDREGPAVFPSHYVKDVLSLSRYAWYMWALKIFTMYLSGGTSKFAEDAHITLVDAISNYKSRFLRLFR